MSSSGNNSTRRAALLQMSGGLLQFVDTARQAGLATAKNTSGAPINKTTLLEEMGAGVALIDYDGDGWLDIFLVNGTILGPGRAPTSYLFHNNRDGTFRDVTQRAGLTRTLHNFPSLNTY